MRLPKRFKPLPKNAEHGGGNVRKTAVFSGDTVRMDEEGFLYFIGRRDEMIKTSATGKPDGSRGDHLLYGNG